MFSQDFFFFRLKDETVAFQCMVRVIVSPSYRKVFGGVDENIYKDILMQFALAEKIFMNVPFRRKDAPIHISFAVSDIVLLGDQTHNLFRKDLDLEYFTKKTKDVKDVCLHIGKDMSLLWEIFPTGLRAKKFTVPFEL